jgi:hypothetical protein
MARADDLRSLVNQSQRGLCEQCAVSDWKRDGVCDACFHAILEWITINITEKLPDNELNDELLEPDNTIIPKPSNN